MMPNVAKITAVDSVECAQFEVSNALVQIQKHQGEVVNRIEQCRCKIMSMADDLSGPAPEVPMKDVTSETRVEGGGRIAETMKSCHHLEGIVDVLEAAISRLEA